MKIEKLKVINTCIVIILLLVVSGCSTNGGNKDDSNNIDAGGNGHITYRLPDGHIYRMEASEGAIPEDLSEAIDALSPGSDEAVNISPDGEWVVLITTRFDSECTDWACLAVVKGDLSSGDVVRASGELIHPEGVAIASGGDLIIYVAGDGTHSRDLWKVTRSGESWSAPQLLTGTSTYEYASWPAISADGSTVVFDCGEEPFGGQGTAICEVETNGAGFRVVLTPADSPSGFPDTGALHSPDYAPGGGIVFEADWGGEQIWHLSAGEVNPSRVSSEFGNDNSPCVLPDGRIVTLWLGRSGNSAGLHEIKVMDPDGNNFSMLLTGSDVEDSGIGCGE